MMAKIKVQAQHLMPGDVVGSGEKIYKIYIAAARLPSNKVEVHTNKRVCFWGKYTMIGVERD